MTLAGVMCVQTFAASTDEVKVPNYVKWPICIENIKADPSCALGIPRWDHEHTDPVTGKTNTYSGKTGEIIESNVGTNNTQTVYPSNDIFITYDFDDPMLRTDGTPEYVADLEDCFITGSMGSAEATGNMGDNNIGPKALEDKGANATKATIESMNLPAWALTHLPASVGGTDGTVIDNRPVATMQVSEWARDYVQTAINKGIVPSHMMNLDYTKPITRADFCIFAVETIEYLTGAELTTDAYDAECSFKGWETIQPFDDIFDADGHGQTAIKKLYSLNIINGYGNNKFGPNDTLTREQSAVILMRMAEALGKPMPRAATPFTDTGTAWSADGISACYGAGVMTGTTAATFDPLAPYTAEQSVVTLVRIMEYVNK